MTLHQNAPFNQFGNACRHRIPVNVQVIRDALMRGPAFLRRAIGILSGQEREHTECRVADVRLHQPQRHDGVLPDVCGKNGRLVHQTIFLHVDVV